MLLVWKLEKKERKQRGGVYPVHVDVCKENKKKNEYD